MHTVCRTKVLDLNIKIVWDSKDNARYLFLSSVHFWDLGSSWSILPGLGEFESTKNIVWQKLSLLMLLKCVFKQPSTLSLYLQEQADISMHLNVWHIARKMKRVLLGICKYSKQALHCFTACWLGTGIYRLKKSARNLIISNRPSKRKNLVAWQTFH